MNGPLCYHNTHWFLFLFCIFRINDRVISANGISLENVDYATAVQVLRDSVAAVNLVSGPFEVAPHVLIL